MTLHWWMHWFWVTAQIVAALTSPTSERSSSGLAIDQESPVIPASPSALSSAESATTIQQEQQETLARLQQNYRIAKAIGIQPRQMAADDSAWLLGRSGSTEDYGISGSRPSTPSPFLTAPSSNASAFETYDDKTTKPPTNSSSGGGKKDSKITRINAYSKVPKLRYEEPLATSPSTLSSTGSEATTASEEQLTVMPLLRPDDPNAIRKEPMVVAGKPAASDDLLLGVEPRIVATAASVLDAGLSDSTRLGRARGTFTSEFHRDQQQHAHHAENKVDTTIKEAHDSRHANVTEIATITGSCLAVIVLLSTVGSLGFIMYRRKYLNPPQTLNSDKCSNPDSSGYIDDSTIRDNSEEMYSLDNDSFLNSLEAMTIQNYWTDSVKHTKL